MNNKQVKHASKEELNNLFEKCTSYMGQIFDEKEFDKYRGSDFSDGYYYLGMFSTASINCADCVGIFESINCAGGLEEQRIFLFSEDSIKIYRRTAKWDSLEENDSYYRGIFSEWQLQINMPMSQNYIQDIEYLNKYGTTDVYVLQENVDIIIKDNVITGTIDNKSLNFNKKTIVIPEGITEIKHAPDSSAISISASTIILPSSIAYIADGTLTAKKIIVAENVKQLTITAAINGNIYLPSTLTYIEMGGNHRGAIYCSEQADQITYNLNSGSLFNTIYCPLNIQTITINSANLDGCKAYIYNAKADIEFNDAMVTACGYAGSTTEEAVNVANKKYQDTSGTTGKICTFVNIGSNYSEKLETKSLILKSPDGSKKFKIIVDNSGNIRAEEVS